MLFACTLKDNAENWKKSRKQESILMEIMLLNMMET